MWFAIAECDIELISVPIEPTLDIHLGPTAKTRAQAKMVTKRIGVRTLRRSRAAGLRAGRAITSLGETR